MGATDTDRKLSFCPELLRKQTLSQCADFSFYIHAFVKDILKSVAHAGALTVCQQNYD